MNILSASLKSRKTVTFEDLIELLKNENPNQQIEQLRTTRAFSDGRLHIPFRNKIPFVGFSAAIRTRDRADYLEKYNGLVLLEINRLATRSDAEVLKERLRAYPQIALAFVGCSGLSVKFLVRFALPDGSLPDSLHTAELFHAHACQKALDYYKMQIDTRVILRSDKLNVRCRLSFDPNLYVNAAAMPICIEQPTRAKADNQWERPHFESDFNPDNEKSGIFFRSQEELRSYYFASALLDAMEAEHHDDPDIYRRNFLVAYMQGCFGSGIGEEEAIHNVLRYGRMRDHENEVRTIFRAGYEMEKHFGNNPAIPKVQHDTLKMISFMKRRYELRRNTLNNTVEYRTNVNFFTPFETIDNIVLNTMSIEALSEGLKVWDRDICRYVNSSKIPAYNPIDRFLEELPKWDGKDYIRQLAAQVPCENRELWTENFYTWFLGMVAGWKQMSKQHANSTLPLLIGDQACGKSTFCKRLLPPELQDYYTDSIDIAKKQEAMLALTRYVLINIDEFDSVSTSYQSFLKHVVQKPVVNIRKPYESSSRALRRYSSFIATCNNDDLLNDPTGSRRYLCVKITGMIDNNSWINYPQLYAQAVEALHRGEQYWFDVEHARKTTEANRDFDIQSTEEKLLLHYFEPADSEKDGKWMSPTEIYLFIRNKSKLKLGNKGLNAFGRVLKKHSFSSRRIKTGSVYLLRPREL